MSSSPNWGSIWLKSRLERVTRAGVPVFIRPTLKPFSRRVASRPYDAGSASRPPGAVYSPMKILPLRKVPVVSTTTLALKRRPRAVTTPVTVVPRVSYCRSTTVSMKHVRLGWSSRVFLARAA